MRVKQLLVPQVPRNPITDTNMICPPMPPINTPTFCKPKFQPDPDGMLKVMPKAIITPDAN